MRGLRRFVWVVVLLALTAAGCTVVPPEGVGPYQTPDWSVLTPSPTAPAATPEPKLVQAVTYPYTTFANMPLFLKNFARTEGCNWMGVAGQVFDRNGNPVTGIVVKVNGQIGTNRINNQSTTGNVSAYGSGGYEIDLSAAPAASTGTLWVMLADSSGKQISPSYSFNTYNDCEKNLILFNFTEDVPNKLYFPAINR